MGLAKRELEKSIDRLQSSNHMLTVSYPLLKDTKILLSVATNLLKACEFAMNALLEMAKHRKIISSYKNDFTHKYNLLIQKVLNEFEVSKIHLKTISRLKEIIKTHKKSSVEFTRKKKFVMASESYELRTLSENDLKNFYQKTKKFVKEVEGVLA